MMVGAGRVAWGVEALKEAGNLNIYTWNYPVQNTPLLISIYAGK